MPYRKCCLLEFGYVPTMPIGYHPDFVPVAVISLLEFALTVKLSDVIVVTLTVLLQEVCLIIDVAT